MAKLVFYLAASQRESASVLETAIEFCRSPFAKTQQLECAVMQPRSNDVLAIPADSAFLQNLSLVLEIQAPIGKPIKPWLDTLEQALGSLRDSSDARQSHVLAATPKVFQDTGSKKQRYHYLMFRAGHYSPSDYLDYYMNSHARFGVVTPLANYLQNYTDAHTTQALAGRFGMQPVLADNVSELHFDNINTYLSCPEIVEAGPAASLDEELFVDRARCQSFSMNVVFNSSQAQT